MSSYADLTDLDEKAPVSIADTSLITPSESLDLLELVGEQQAQRTAPARSHKMKKEATAKAKAQPKKTDARYREAGKKSLMDGPLYYVALAAILAVQVYVIIWIVKSEVIDLSFLTEFIEKIKEFFRNLFN